MADVIASVVFLFKCCQYSTFVSDFKLAYTLFICFRVDSITEMNSFEKKGLPWGGDVITIILN